MDALRPYRDSDAEALLELNNAAVPNVSEADAEHVQRLIAWSSIAWVLDPDVGDGIAGFVLLMEPGTTYTSPNYRWFAERYDRFLYVDRVVVAESQRGRGLGTELYRAVIAEAAARGAGRVTAEVNLVPPNPGSSRFHRSLGFERVGTLEQSPDYVVEMLAREVSG